MNYAIRPATLDDLRDLVALRRSMFEAMGHADAEGLHRMAEAFDRYCRERLSTGDFRVWIAEAGGRPIASIGLVLHHVPPSTTCQDGLKAYIMNIVTLPEFRRLGIATALLDRVIETVKSEGIHRVYLHATSDGCVLYGRAGFRINEDLPEMCLTLDSVAS